MWDEKSHIHTVLYHVDNLLRIPRNYLYAFMEKRGEYTRISLIQ